MKRFSAQWLFLVAFVSLSVLALVFRPRCDAPLHGRPAMEDWDIPQLVGYLNGAGLDLRPAAVLKDGRIGTTAFLTTRERDWAALNALSKDPARIHEWHGVLYCERVGERETTTMVAQWGEHCLVVKPFIFYGDGELLTRVHTVLAPVAPPASHREFMNTISA